MLVGTVQRDSSSYYKKFIPDNINFSKMKISDIHSLNPILTDQTQCKQTDLQYIFSQNPDVNGLSLILDDSAKRERLSSVSIDDFLEPKDHYDIFDINNFIENAKYQFTKLPISFRMQFGNDPFNLISSLSDPSTSSKVIAALSDALGSYSSSSFQLQSSEKQKSLDVESPPPSSDSSSSDSL